MKSERATLAVKVRIKNYIIESKFKALLIFPKDDQTQTEKHLEGFLEQVFYMGCLYDITLWVLLGQKGL